MFQLFTGGPSESENFRQAEPNKTAERQHFPRFQLSSVKVGQKMLLALLLFGRIFVCLCVCCVLAPALPKSVFRHWANPPSHFGSVAMRFGSADVV